MAKNNESFEKGDSFGWTDSEIELLLECIKEYSSKCRFDGIDWEGVKSKYEKIRTIFVGRYPKASTEEVNENFPKAQNLLGFTKDQIASKMKTIRKSYKKAVDLGRRSGGGRVVMTFYDLCNDVWVMGLTAYK